MHSGKEKNTTIRDVARKAEVSIATVSRVVNSNRPVQADIRERVLKAVEELDYRPNFLARGLRQSNTCMIGLVIPDNSNPFYAEIVRAIEDAGFAAGYSVILCNWDMAEEKLLSTITRVAIWPGNTCSVCIIGVLDALPYFIRTFTIHCALLAFDRRWLMAELN